mgnify:CR=1 FL=1
MSGLLQKADLTMLEEQIQKMQNAYEYAEKTTQIIKKVQKKLRGQDGRRAVQIKNALHEQDERSQELSSDLTNLKDGLVWVENLMYYADQEAARQLGAEDDGSWDMKRKAFEEARARLPNEDPVILILNGGNILQFFDLFFCRSDFFFAFLDHAVVAFSVRPIPYPLH